MAERAEFRVVSGQDLACHLKDAMAIFKELRAVVRNHGRHLVITIATQQRISGDDGGLFFRADHKRYMARNVTGGYEASDPIRQGTRFEPPELLRRPQPLQVPPAQSELSQVKHVLVRLLV